MKKRILTKFIRWFCSFVLERIFLPLPILFIKRSQHHLNWLALLAVTLNLQPIALYYHPLLSLFISFHFISIPFSSLVALLSFFLELQFNHPNSVCAEMSDNSRFATASFIMPENVTVHGLAGTFECVLYDDVTFSTVPHTFSTGQRFEWVSIKNVPVFISI